MASNSWLSLNWILDKLAEKGPSYAARGLAEQFLVHEYAHTLGTPLSHLHLMVMARTFEGYGHGSGIPYGWDWNVGGLLRGLFEAGTLSPAGVAPEAASVYLAYNPLTQVSKAYGTEGMGMSLGGDRWLLPQWDDNGLGGGAGATRGCGSGGGG